MATAEKERGLDSFDGLDDGSDDWGDDADDSTGVDSEGLGFGRAPDEAGLDYGDEGADWSDDFLSAVENDDTDGVLAAIFSSEYEELNSEIGLDDATEGGLGADDDFEPVSYPGTFSQEESRGYLDVLASYGERGLDWTKSAWGQGREFAAAGWEKAGQGFDYGMDKMDEAMERELESALDLGEDAAALGKEIGQRAWDRLEHFANYDGSGAAVYDDTADYMDRRRAELDEMLDRIRKEEDAAVRQLLMEDYRKARESQMSPSGLP